MRAYPLTAQTPKRYTPLMEPETDRPAYEASLSREAVNRIAALAQLELSEEEISRYQQQLSDVLDYFRQLSEVDTTDCPTSVRPTVTPDQLRADIATTPLPTEAALANAPDREADRFRVPAVLPEND